MGILDAPSYAKAEADNRFANHLFSFDGSRLMKWNKALAKVRNGEADAKLLCLGDSTTTGIGSSTAATIAATKSYPGRLAELMNSYMVPAAPGLALPKSNSSSQPADNRWTIGTGWAQDPSGLIYVGFGGKGMFYRGTGVTAGSLVFSDVRVLADTFDVYYRLQPASGSTGTFSVSATGGGVTTVDAAVTGGLNRIGKVTVTASTVATNNTVIIAGLTAAKNVDIVGVEPYLSTTKKVRIGNGGASGSKTADWTAYYQGNATFTYGALDAIKAYGPDLTIIDLGINDAGGAVDIATYSANLALIIATCQASGDVILKTPLPSGGNTEYVRIPYEVQYGAHFKTLGLPVIDFNARVVDYATYFAAGFMQGDGLHGNDYSYLDMASFVLSALRRV